jgi:hypothetical protein
MAGVDDLHDLFARCVLTLCRRAGLRIGECLDLTLDCVVDYGPAGTWLRVPLGKLATDDMAYQNLNTLLTSSSDLVAAIRKNPKKYLVLRLKIF